MSRNGKIARLPLDIRSQLNHRLIDGQTAAQILTWVNALPETQELLKAHFEGIPLSPQNLSEWRTGGFLEWQAQLELLHEADAMDEQAQRLRKSPGEGHLIDRVADVLAARYAKLVNHLPEEPDEKFEAQVKLLVRLTRSVVQLQKSIHRAAKQNDEARERAREREAEAKEEARNRELLLLDAPEYCEELARRWGGKENALRLAAHRFEVRHDLNEEEAADLEGSLLRKYATQQEYKKEQEAAAAAAKNAGPATQSN